MGNDELLAAFIAGFEASAEGYNGEVRPVNMNMEAGTWDEPELSHELREKFERWLASRAVAN